MTWQAKQIDYDSYLGRPFTSFRSMPNQTEVHVYPEKDLVEHVLVGLECTCGVYKKLDSGVIIHNSWDLREFFENEEGMGVTA